MKREIYTFCLAVMVVFLAGCTPIQSQQQIYERPHIKKPVLMKDGVYHKVGAGQTLWRIAKVYNVTIDDIIRANYIPNAAKIEKNQLIFIPGAKEVKRIVIELSEDQKEFVWPVEGKIIKYFKDKRGNRLSKGIDIQVPEGVKVKAARTGRVVFADYLSGYNQTVILDHEDGFYSVYAQNSKVLVDLGEYIFKNSPIAVVGTNGNRLAHLHFEIRKKSVEDNPLYYLP